MDFNLPEGVNHCFLQSPDNCWEANCWMNPSLFSGALDLFESNISLNNVMFAAIMRSKDFSNLLAAT